MWELCRLGKKNCSYWPCTGFIEINFRKYLVSDPLGINSFMGIGVWCHEKC